MAGPDDPTAAPPEAASAPAPSPENPQLSQESPAASVQPSTESAPVAPAAEAVSLPDAAAVGDDTTKSEETPEVASTLLEEFDADAAKPEEGEAKTEPDKPAEAAKDEPEVQAEAKVEEPPAVEPVDYFKDVEIPEGLSLDDAQRDELAAALTELGTDRQKGMQTLLGMHVKAVSDAVQNVTKDQWKVFNDTKVGWRKQVQADPELGGAGYRTEMAKVAQVRDAFVSSAKPGTPAYEQHMQEFKDFLRVTGAGDHPAFIRLLHNAFPALRRPDPPPPEPKPAPGNGKAPNGKFSIYTHPSSQVS